MRFRQQNDWTRSIIPLRGKVRILAWKLFQINLLLRLGQMRLDLLLPEVKRFALGYPMQRSADIGNYKSNDARPQQIANRPAADFSDAFRIAARGRESGEG